MIGSRRRKAASKPAAAIFGVGLSKRRSENAPKLNLQTSYDVSKTMRATLTMTGLVDRCFQRGYPWDDNNICVYLQLPSGGADLGPSGNFVPLAQTPIQLNTPTACSATTSTRAFSA